MDDPIVQEGTDNMLDLGISIIGEGEVAREDIEEHLKGALQHGGGARVFYVANRKQFDRNKNIIRNCLVDGDLRPAISIVEQAYGVGHPDEVLLHLIDVDKIIATVEPDSPKPVGWSDLITLAAQVRRNPLLELGRKSNGLSIEELDTFERAIKETGGTPRQWWTILDVLSNVQKANCISKLERLLDSDKLPKKTREGNLNTLLTKSLKTDVEAHMLSWIEGRYLFSLDEEVDLEVMGDAFQKIGLDVRGELNEGEYTGTPQQGERWIGRTSEGQTWIVSSDPDSYEIKVYESSEEEEPSALLIQSDFGDERRVYASDAPKLFLEKFKAIGGGIGEHATLTDAAMDNFNEIMVRLPDSQKIAVMRAFSRLTIITEPKPWWKA